MTVGQLMNFGQKSLKRKVLSSLAVILMLFVPVQTVLAAGISVGAGSTISVSSGSIDLGCGDIEVIGTLNLNTGTLTRAASVFINGVMNGNAGLLDFGKDWVLSGTFNPGSSTVSLVDECGDGSSAISGSSTFWSLGIFSDIGKAVSFEAGSTTTVLNDIQLVGGSGSNLLGLGSSASPVKWILMLAEAGSQLVDFVAVKDSDATGLYMARGFPQEFRSVDLGGNNRWFRNFALHNVPTLPVWTIVLVIGSIFLIEGMRRRRVRPGLNRR